MFCLLQPPIQHLVKKQYFVDVDATKYTSNTSLYLVADNVCIMGTTINWIH